MNYRDIIDALEVRFAEQVKARKGGEDELRRVRQAKAWDDAGVVIPESLRQWLRRVWEADNPEPCDRIDKRGACVWLSKRAGPNQSLPCPFYQRGDDPRTCHGYKPFDPVSGTKKKGLVIV